MKKFLICLAITTTLLSTVSCGSEVASTAGTENSTAGTESSTPAEPEEDLTEEISFSIPSDLMGTEITQQELDAQAAKNGYKSLTLNDDGSVTYVMTKGQHIELMEELKVEYTQQLDDLISSDAYPNFVSIKTTDDFTSFVIVTKSEELDYAESFSSIIFMMMGGLYNMFNGIEDADIDVTFINEATGEAIEQTNSSQLGQQ